MMENACKRGDVMVFFSEAKLFMHSAGVLPNFWSVCSRIPLFVCLFLLSHSLTLS